MAEFGTVGSLAIDVRIETNLVHRKLETLERRLVNLSKASLASFEAFRRGLNGVGALNTSVAGPLAQIESSLLELAPKAKSATEKFSELSAAIGDLGLNGSLNIGKFSNALGTVVSSVGVMSQKNGVALGSLIGLGVGMAEVGARARKLQRQLGNWQRAAAAAAASQRGLAASSSVVASGAGILSTAFRGIGSAARFINPVVGTVLTIGTVLLSMGRNAEDAQDKVDGVIESAKNFLTLRREMAKTSVQRIEEELGAVDLRVEEMMAPLDEIATIRQRRAESSSSPTFGRVSAAATLENDREPSIRLAQDESVATKLSEGIGEALVVRKELVEELQKERKLQDELKKLFGGGTVENGVLRAREVGKQQIEGIVTSLEREAQILSAVGSERENLSAKLRIEEIARKAGIANIDEWVARAAEANRVIKERQEADRAAAKTREEHNRRLEEARHLEETLKSGLQKHREELQRIEDLLPELIELERQRIRETLPEEITKQQALNLELDAEASARAKVKAALEKQEDAYKELDPVQQEAKRRQEELKRATETLGQETLSTLTDALKSGANTWREWGEVALESLERVLLAWIQFREQTSEGGTTVTGGLGGFIDDIFGGLFGGLFGGGGSSSGTAAILAQSSRVGAELGSVFLCRRVAGLGLKASPKAVPSGSVEPEGSTASLWPSRRRRGRWWMCARRARRGVTAAMSSTSISTARSPTKTM